MSNEQMYLAIGLPIIVNTLFNGFLILTLRDLWRAELRRVDAANQHVKILEKHRNGAVAACLRSCAQTIMENELTRPQSIAYLNQYADTVLANPEGPITPGPFPQPASGPPIPDLAAQPDSNKKTSDSLGSTVPPGSESARASSDKPPFTSSHGSEIPERGKWRVGSKVPLNVYENDRPVCQCHSFMDALEIVNAMNAIAEDADTDMERWRLQGDLARSQQALQRAMGELDAANQHVKILEEHRNGAVAACLRSCAQTIMENEMSRPQSIAYLNQYADTVLANTEGPITPGGERLSETMTRVFQLWNTARGELDAANQHVKILEKHRNGAVAACLRSCAQTIMENEMTRPQSIAYLNQYADTVLANPEGPITPGPFPQPTSGPPTPDLAAQPDSTTKEWRRHPTPFDAGPFPQPAGGHPTPDPAAQPDSIPEERIPDPTNAYECAYQSINRLERLQKQRIGVHDYASFVSCLRAEYRIIFPDLPLTDPQDMIQRMTAEIQMLRRTFTGTVGQ